MFFCARYGEEYKETFTVTGTGQVGVSVRYTGEFQKNNRRLETTEEVNVGGLPPIGPEEVHWDKI